jgi:hypothetical protein
MDREIFYRGDHSGPLNSIRVEGYGVGWKTDEFETERSRIERLAVSKRVGRSGAGHSDMRFGTIDKVLMDNHRDPSGSFNLLAKRC